MDKILKLEKEIEKLKKIVNKQQGYIMQLKDIAEKHNEMLNQFINMQRKISKIVIDNEAFISEDLHNNQLNVDDILAKISKHGINSLTDEERKILYGN